MTESPGAPGSKACYLVPVHGQTVDIFYERRCGPALLPGDLSRAPGIFFLDELPEFRRHVIEVLRQPIEMM